jgi:hypothetical protein
MYPSTHIIIGAIASFLIWLIFPSLTWWQVFIIFASSILIDVDHYLWYAIKKKDWSLRRAYQWHVKKSELFQKMDEKERNKFKHLLVIFHGIEFWLFLILLIFINKIFLFVLIGIVIHMILDYIDLYRWKAPFYTKTSQIAVIVKNKKKKRVSI